MRAVTLTWFNQHVSAVTREVEETGEPVQVTRRGKPLLRLVPEPQQEEGPRPSGLWEGKGYWIADDFDEWTAEDEEMWFGGDDLL